MRKMDIDEIYEFKECEGGYTPDYFRLKDDPSAAYLSIPSEYKGKPVKAIGTFAFSNAEYLQTVKVPKGIEKIGDHAFHDCKELRSVILPEGLESIGEKAFADCEKLEDVTFSKGLRSIGDDAFISSGIRAAILPEGLEDLGAAAFYYCFKLSAVNIPKSLKIIKHRTFLCCHELDSIVFPDDLKVIEERAFMCCRFKSLTFPSGLERLDFQAFGECEKLETVDFGGGSPKMDTCVFDKCFKLGAENALQAISCSVDITKPFTRDELSEFFNGDWEMALRKDVFLLELKYNKFDLIIKDRIFKQMVWHNAGELFPYAEEAGWDISEECIKELLDISTKEDFTEITAWLLDYKNRHFGISRYKYGEAHKK